MQRYKFLIGLFAAAALFASGAAAAATTPKIGVIDVNYIVSHSKRGEAAHDALQALYNKKKASLDKEKAKLEATKADLQGAKDKKSDAFKKKVAAFQQSAGAFQQHIQQSQSEVEKRRSDLLQPIINDLKKVLAQYAKKHGYTLILNRTTDAVAFASATYDLNDEMVKALDEFEGEK